MSGTIRATVRQTGPSTSLGQARDHEVLVDRPEAKGGADRGPMGGELLLLAVGGCFMSNLLAAIRAREADIREVEVGVEATLEGTPQRMTAFTLTVTGSGEDRDLLPKLATIAERACLVANTLRPAAELRVQAGPAV